MNRFDSFDHDNALRACWDAREFGADMATLDADIVILNRAAGAFACNAQETLTRREFSEALDRVCAAVAAAQTADPERTTRVMKDRRARQAQAKAQEAERVALLRAEKEAAKREAFLNRKAALAAFGLGLRNREGFQYIGQRKAAKSGLAWQP